MWGYLGGGGGVGRVGMIGRAAKWEKEGEEPVLSHDANLCEVGGGGGGFSAEKGVREEKRREETGISTGRGSRRAQDKKEILGPNDDADA